MKQVAAWAVKDNKTNTLVYNKSGLAVFNTFEEAKRSKRGLISYYSYLYNYASLSLVPLYL